MTDLSNRVALITGASRGIGAATAQKLASYGAKVVLTARSEDRLTQVAEAITAAGGTALALRCDVSVYEDVLAAVARCVDHFGTLDLQEGSRNW